MATVKGPLSWNMSRDKEGHRDYNLKLLVQASSATEGPNGIMNASGAPTIGSPWSYDGDSDYWAKCWPTLKVNPRLTGEPNLWWEVDYLFSTKPLSRCQDESIEDPLDEPMKISGSFSRYSKKTEVDRNGKLIKSSSHEVIDGIEKDANRPTVIIEQNVLDLGLDTFAAMVNTLNDAPLWDLNERCIMLTNAPWERKLYGLCNFYFTRRFEFEIRYDGFDLSDIADAGFKKFDKNAFADNAVNRADPTKYIIAKDGNGENPPRKILLDGTGDPLTDPLNPIFLPTVEVADQSNFLLLGIPTNLAVP